MGSTPVDQGVQYLLLVEFIFLSAGAFYGVLYWLIMPLKLHDQPLYLDYSNRNMVRMLGACSHICASATLTSTLHLS